MEILRITAIMSLVEIEYASALNNEFSCRHLCGYPTTLVDFRLSNQTEIYLKENVL